ncbi:MAG: tetratricopeptide repeat protein [Bacteroidetes bacterium]|nr:tetratricopeptide repeat protein [Bacteroidota bacterium]MBU1718423.1 tetratricopeptide repeat protein [Bacteroidota bacterium]
MHRIVAVWFFALFAGVSVNLMAQDLPNLGDVNSTVDNSEPLDSIFLQGSDEQLAAYYFQNKEYDKAVYLYEKLYNKKPETSNYSPYLSCLIILEDFSKAEKLVKKHIKRNPGVPIFQVDLGFVYKKSGDTKKAQQQFEASIASLKSSPYIVNDLAAAFETRNETAYALETYQQARKMMNLSTAFWRQVSNLYIKASNYQAAITEMLDAIDKDYEYYEEVKDGLWTIIEGETSGSREEMFRVELLKRIQKRPDKVIYADLFVWFLIQKSDYAGALTQVKALDKRLKEDGQRVYELAGIAVRNQSYDIAVQAYKYLIAKGPESFYYVSSKTELARTLFTKITSTPGYTKTDLNDLSDTYRSTLEELGINGATIYLVKDYSHLLAFYLDSAERAIELLDQVIAIPNSKPEARAECKLELGDVFLMTGDKWEAILLYKQVEKEFKTNPIGHEAKFRGARFYFYTGDFYLAKDQLDVLKAATSKLIANDALRLSLIITDNLDPDSGTVALEMYARADLLVFRNKFDDALATLDSIAQVFLTHPIADVVLFKKAEIKLKTGKYTEAAKFFEEVSNTYEWDILGHEALFRLAEMQENIFKDTAKAMEYYREYMERYPGGIYTGEARKRFRALRGDQIN